MHQYGKGTDYLLCVVPKFYYNIIVIENHSDSTLRQFGTRLMSPALKSALWVSWVVVLLELVSSLLPGIGYIITLPFTLLTYTTQGILTGHFTARNPNFRAASSGDYLRQGALSAVWTSVVFSTGVTLLIELILTPVTAGFSLVALPPVIISSLVDLGLNLALTALFAWVYARFGFRWSIVASCAAALIGSTIFACMGAGIIGVLISALRHS
jgi:hypothetical protein